MMPRLGAKYPIEIEVASKPKAEYHTDEYFDLGLPVAPAVMVAEEIVVEGSDVEQFDIEVSICKQLHLPLPESENKGFFKKLFKE
jgi:hypothetical protein